MWIQSQARDIDGTKTKRQKLCSPLSLSYLRWVTWITTCTNRHQSNMWCDTKPSHSLTKLANLLNDQTTEYCSTVNNSIWTTSIRTRQFNCDKNVKLNRCIGPWVIIYHQFISTTTENMLLFISCGAVDILPFWFLLIFQVFIKSVDALKQTLFNYVNLWTLFNAKFDHSFMKH